MRNWYKGLCGNVANNGRAKKHGSALLALFLLVMGVTVLSVTGTGCSIVDTVLKNSSHQGPYDINASLKEMTRGQDLSGFKLVEKEYSADYEADIYLFEHKKNGGQVVYIAADDNNKWFSAMFKTPAVDDTGVNHILEHTVLEGSKKFPVKSPFTEMSKRSVSTFMNAMTGSDVTTYPIASENDKDFDNLMRVYLDAVFAPLVVDNELLMMQEGWRFEGLEGQPNQEELKQASNVAYNGVVLNEMRGALSDRYDWIYTQIPKYLYPDTAYRFNSGGDPLSIVDLTHKALAKTHDRYYHPKNACLIFYGNLNLSEKLEYLDQNYYQDAVIKEKASMVSYQEPFNEVQTNILSYPASEGEVAESDSILSYSTAVTGTNLEDTIGLELLMSLLADGYGTPLYNDTVEQGMGYELSGYVDTTYEQPMFHLLLEGASDKSMDEFSSVIDTKLTSIVEEGMDKTADLARIQGVINQYALAFKSSLNVANRGENALYVIELGFITHNDPFYAINSLKALGEIEQKVKEGGYFEGLISNFLLENKHQSHLVLVPVTDLTSATTEALDNKLVEMLDKMTPEEIAALEQKISDYSEYEAQPLNQEHLAMLPKLSVEDLNLNAPDFKGDIHKVDQVTVLTDEVQSHGVTGVKLYFDLEGLSQEEFHYLPLLVTVTNIANTATSTREDIDTALNMYSSGLESSLEYLQDPKDARHAKAYFTTGIQYLSDNSEQVLPIIADLLTKADYNDLDVIENALGMQISNVEGAVNGEGDSLALMYHKAALTCAGAMAINEYSTGYEKLANDLTHFEDKGSEVAQKVADLAKKVFVKSRLTVSVAADKTGQKSAKSSITSLLNALDLGKGSGKGDLASSDSATWKPIPSALKSDSKIDGVAISSDMHYVELGFHLSQVNHQLKGSDLVFMQMLSDGYMYEQIRLKGGAYGGYAGISSDNTVYFTAYRAPDYQTTLQAVQNVTDFLKLKSFSPSDIENGIVAVAGRMYQSQDVFVGVDGGVREYLMPSLVEGQDLLQEMLDTNENQLAAFIDFLQVGISKSYGLVVGPRESLEAPDSAINHIFELRH